MSGYTKLFQTLLESSVWSQPDHVRVVWIAMMAMADRDGHVSASVPGLAHRARVTREQCEAALALFLAPDPDSRTKDHDGRRIEVVDGGWRLLNHEKYRHKASEEERREKGAERQRRFKARKAAEKSLGNAEVTPGNASVTRNNASNDIAEAEAEDPPKAPKGALLDSSSAKPETGLADEVAKAPSVSRERSGAGGGGACSGAKAASLMRATEGDLALMPFEPPTSKPDPVRDVFEHWRRVMGHERAKLDDKRRSRIKAAMKFGYTPTDLIAAINGCRASAWHMGANDRGTRFDGLELILRNADHIDKFIALAPTNPARSPPSSSGPSDDAVEAMRARLREQKQRIAGGGQ